MKSFLLLFAAVLCAVSGIAQPLLSESFNVSTATTSLPTGWTVSSVGTTTGCNGLDWMQVPSGGFICSVNGTPSPRPTAQSGSGMAGYNSWDIDQGSSSVMVSPSLNFSALGSYTLSFWVFQQNTMISNAHDTLKVYVNTSPSTTGGTLLYASDPNYNSSPAGWAQYTFNIPTTYTGTTNYIVFYGWSNWGQDIFIDDVVVDHIPPTPCTGTPQAPSISNAAITIPVCQNNTYTLNGVDPNLPTTSGIAHQWYESASATGPWTAVTGGTGATTTTYTTGALTSSLYYRLGSTCTNSNITSYSAAFFVPVGAPQPGAISGSTTFCAGDTSTYSVPNVSGTTYTWTLPAGWSGSSTTNQILVTPGSTGGSISVTATTTCGSSVAQTLTVAPGIAPPVPGSILGSNNICFGATETYSILPVIGATSYQWTLPSGWTGSSTTNSITVTSNSTSGNIVVRALNGCGQSPAATLAVSIITALDNPGTITGPDTVCSGSLYTYYIHPVPGATSYSWTLPYGWSGTTTDTSVQVFAGSTTGTIQVTAYAACATSPVSDTVLVVHQTVHPAVSLSAPAGQLCQGSQITITANAAHPGPSPTYQWTVNNTPVLSYGNSYTGTFNPGDSIQVVLSSNAICASNPVAVSNVLKPLITPSVTPGVSINTVPPVNICKGTPVTFTTTSAATGSAPAYQWYKNGVLIPGATGDSYTDPSLNDGDTLTIQLTSNAVCATFTQASSNKVGVHVMPRLTASVSVSVSPDNIAAPGKDLTFTATSSNGGHTPDYQWYKNGVVIPFETGVSYTSRTLKAGDHISVSMLSYEQCVDIPYVRSNNIALRSSLGIEGTAGQASVTLYPNPTDGRFTLALRNWAQGGSPVRIEVLNAAGQLVHQAEQVPVPAGAGSARLQVDISHKIPPGSYIVRLSTADGLTTAVPFSK